VSKKYEREIDLRLYGDKVEAQKYILRAREVLGDVWNRDIELGGLDQSWRRVTLDDRAYVTIYATTFMNPIVTITVRPEGGLVKKPQYILKLAWWPEGIIITPRTDEDGEAPLGWGLPSRKYDTSEKLNLELNDQGEPINSIGLTPDGSLPQMLLNRFANNKYLDLIEHIDNLPDELAGLVDTEGAFPNPQLSDSVEAIAGSDQVLYQTTAVISQPWSYIAPDAEGNYPDGYYIGPDFWVDVDPDAELTAGIYKVETFTNGVILATTLGYQFGPNFEHLITEEKAADVLNEETFEFEQQWYTHKPEEKLYVDAISESIFQQTNTYREGAGEGLVYRMIRGDANSARMAGYILALSDGHFFHSHPDFLTGYKTTGARVQLCTGEEPFNALADNVRENLAAVSPDAIPPEVDTPELIGIWIAEQWRDSPPHYANMISAQWTEFGLPFNSFGGYPDGTRGASHHIGSFGTNDYVDRSDARDSSVTIPIIPPAEDAAIWAQSFCARSSWVPIYDWLHEGQYGAIGTFNGWNAYSHGNFVSSSRRIGWGKHVYQLPAGLVDPFADPDAEELSPFLSCAGGAMIEIDGEKWIRAVYWESDVVIEALEDIAFGDGYPQEGDWVRIKVIRFPVKIHEASVMPWRKDIPAECDVEFEYEWSFAAGGWLSNPPGKVIFNSTGDKFCFSLHALGDDEHTQALSYKAEDWTTERSDLPLPRIDVQTHHFEWTTDLIDIPLVGDWDPIMSPVPLTAAVVCWTDEANNPDGPDVYANNELTTFYSREVKGQLQMFPHYDKNDNLKYILLDIDEKTFMKGNRDSGTTLPDEDSYCWRVRKMIFPSGKEITYMQQYMQDRWTTTFSPDISDPNYKPWPGTGDENYLCFIHWFDELREDVVYSKVRTDKIVVDYGFPNNWYRIDGDIDYIADLGEKPDDLDPEAPEQIIEIIDTIPYDINNTALNVYDVDGDNWAHDDGLPNTQWIYNVDFSPCTAMVVQDDSYPNVPAGQIGANTTGFTIPENVAGTTMSFTPGPAHPGPYDPDDGVYKRPAYRAFPEQRVDYPAWRPFFGDHKVSCFTGYTYYGDSNIWYFGTGKLAKSTQRCNISPLFSKAGEVRCKVVRYDGRILVYVGIEHVNKYGLAAPEYFKPESEAFMWSEWERVLPPEDKKVMIWSNFDLDEAIGIEDITDIWPVGKII
jgi:hypothetical protein